MIYVAGSCHVRTVLMHICVPYTVKLMDVYKRRVQYWAK